MKKFLFNIFFDFLKVINFFSKKIFKENLFFKINETIEVEAYENKKILGNDIKFFVPNKLVSFRVQTYFTKEPETIEWINKFDNTNKFYFWDIGSNIGLFSIYAALKHSNVTVISFEPSTSNLRILSRNISINSLNNKIQIFQVPLGDKPKSFLQMNESSFSEGSALHSYSKNINHQGHEFSAINNYNIYGTTINDLISENILDVPKYMKIDIDGLEHLVLKEGDKCLSSNKLKSISIEINENFKEQLDKILEIMKNNNYRFKQKKRSCLIDYDKSFSKTYNYVFEK